MSHPVFIEICELLGIDYSEDAREILKAIKSGDHHLVMLLGGIQLLIKKTGELMATLDEVKQSQADEAASISALKADVDAAVAKLGAPPVATAADLDVLKANADANKSAVDGLKAELDPVLNPPA